MTGTTPKYVLATNLYNTGLSLRQVAAQMGIKSCTVHGYIRYAADCGLHVRPYKPQHYYAQTAELYNAGHSTAAIAEMTGRSRKAVNKSICVARDKGLLDRDRKIELGKMTTVRKSISLDVWAWLKSITPEGLTVAHTIASICTDAHADEVGA